MLITLQQELNNLQQSGKEKEQRIESLYINLQEIYNLQSNLDKPAQTKNNMLHQVRPEVFHQIIQFLDLKSFFQFRLLSRRANDVIKLMIPQKISCIQKQMSEHQDELQLKIQLSQEEAKDENSQNMLQAAFDGLNQLQKAHINELKALARPTELIERIINLICLILDSKFKIQKDNWRECQKILSRQDFLQQIISLDINSINDKQLKQIEQVESISPEQAGAQSIVARSLLIFLKGVVNIRQTKLYIYQNQIKELKLKIKKEEQVIERLGKIMNK
ncbi:unnamed protein product [Paramecium sonneborni]|uniref:F-box domain-containing protein n=1 Tax=Paramecium sonneborni TaxID=65129 RepID=A0A8S1Q7U4_9CILI|nr:unnamed protein product [Paramecium sonneborni]